MTSRGRLSRVVGLLLLIGCAVEAGTARAEGDPATTDLLLKALELRRQHRNEEALALYEQVFAVSPTPAVRAQRGLAEQALGRWMIAEEDLESALASDDPWVARKRASLDSARLVVREHLAWLRVDVDVPRAEVLLDGKPIAVGSEARVPAGTGTVEVRAEGFTPNVRPVSLAPSEHVHWTVTLAPLVAAVPPVAAPAPSEVPASSPPPPAATITPPVEAPRESRSIVPTLSLALGIAGVAGIATGSYFGARTFQDRSNERMHCIGGCTTVAANDYSDAQTSASISTVAIVAGAGLAVGGAALWFLGRSSPHTTGALQVTPVVGLGMNGLVLRGNL
jgi:hypothetical protein